MNENFVNKEWIKNESLKIMMKWEIKLIEERWKERNSLRENLYEDHETLISL